MRRRALQVLRHLAGIEEADPEFEPEIVRDGESYWFGMERLRRATVEDMLRCTAISSTGNSGMEHFSINDTGRAIARRPELADEVQVAIARGRPFSVKDDRVVEI